MDTFFLLFMGFPPIVTFLFYIVTQSKNEVNGDPPPATKNRVRKVSVFPSFPSDSVATSRILWYDGSKQ